MVKPIDSKTFIIPFLSENPTEVWKKAEQNAKPVSKEEVMKRAQAVKEKSGKVGK